MYDDEWMCVPIVWRENRPEHWWCRWMSSSEHMCNLLTQLSMLETWREQCFYSIDTLGGDTTRKSHCGVKKDVPVLQFVWQFIIKWICLSMLLIKGSVFTFFFFSIFGCRTNCNIERQISLNGSNWSMWKRNKLFSQGRAFDAFLKEMENWTCDPKLGDALPKRGNNIISNSNQQAWRRAFYLFSARKASARYYR